MPPGVHSTTQALARASLRPVSRGGRLPERAELFPRGPPPAGLRSPSRRACSCDACYEVCRPHAALGGTACHACERRLQHVGPCPASLAGPAPLLLTFFATAPSCCLHGADCAVWRLQPHDASVALGRDALSLGCSNPGKRGEYTPLDAAAQSLYGLCCWLWPPLGVVPTIACAVLLFRKQCFPARAPAP